MWRVIVRAQLVCNEGEVVGVRLDQEPAPKICSPKDPQKYGENECQEKALTQPPHSAVAVHLAICRGHS